MKAFEAMLSPSVLEKGHARTDSSATAESQTASSPRSSNWLGISTKTFFSRTSSLPVVEKPASDSPRRWSFSFSGHGEKEPKESPIVRSRKYKRCTRLRSLLTKTVLDTPEGYPSVATFLDSDENFMLYRRFGYLQARLLLDKQDDLRRLEAKLDKLDKEVSEGDRSVNLSTRDLKPEDVKIRGTLMDEIERRFCEYGEQIMPPFYAIYQT